jgi:hypothetical protein
MRAVKRLADPKVLIVSGAVLVAILLVASAAIFIILDWHISTSDQQWCTFYADVTRSKAVSPVLYEELTKARAAAGCG